MTSLSTISTPFDILAPADLSGSLLPSYPVEIETKKTVLLSQSETGARQTLVKSKSFRFYTLQFRNRKRSEFDDFQPLWEDAYPSWTFQWENSIFDANGEFYFDSPVRWQPARMNLVSYSVALKRQAPITTVVQPSNALPSSPSYNYDGTPNKQVLISDSPDQSRVATELSSVWWPFNLLFQSRSLAECLLMEQFWDYHYPGRQITYTDPVLGVAGDFWIDSIFKWRVRGVNLVDYSFAVREA
jgi:hypothetical protein